MGTIARPRLTKKAEGYRQRVQAKLYSCELDQSLEADGMWYVGEPVELTALFDEVNVPEKLRKIVAAHLHCPYCGNDTIHIGDDVGVEPSFERAIRRHLDKAVRDHGTRIDDFADYLEKYPTLGATHPFGRRLRKGIRSGKVPSRSVGGTWYRARADMDGTVLTSAEMWAAPVGKSSEARFNHAGQRTVYLGSTRDTVVREVVDDAEKQSRIVWIQEFELEPVQKVLDLSGDWWVLGPETDPALVAVLGRGVLEQFVEDRANRWKPEYFVPRFVMDCAREQGYSGIQYSSTRGGILNLVLFDPDAVVAHAKGAPQLVRSDDVLKEELDLWGELDFTD
jgi:hypothetical protein